MALINLKLIDYLIISIVLLLVISAIMYLIHEKKQGKNIDCGNCPLANSCHKDKKDCPK